MNIETNSNHPNCILRIDSMSEIEQAQIRDGYPLLRINDQLAFNLPSWVEAAPWRANAIQPLEGSRRRALKEDMKSRGMDKRPVLDLIIRWVADGNTRLIIFDECRRDGIDIHFPGFEVREFPDDVARADYQIASAIGQRHLATKERKRLVRDGIRRHSEWTDNRLGALFGLTQDTITRISQEMVDAGELAARPDKRIGADGREYDAPKMKPTKAKTQPTAHPASKLIEAWHRERGGHGTTSDNLLTLAEAEEIDLKNLGAFRGDQNERARRLALTAWLSRLLGSEIGGFMISATRAPNGWSSFSLVRPQDYRSGLNGTNVESIEEES